MTTTFNTMADFQKAEVAINTDNARLCLSPQRYFGLCFKCPVFKTKKGKICESALIVKDKMEEIEQLVADKLSYMEKLREIEGKLKQVGL